MRRTLPESDNPASPDGEALWRVARGDASAIGEVYDRHARALLRFATRLHGAADAEDIVQTVFVRAAHQAPTYDSRISSARSWLFGITALVIKERRRALARMVRALVRFGASSPPPQMPPYGQRRDIARGLATLSEVQRMVLLSSDVEGFAGEEIATMLNVPVGTVWTRLHHARRKVREFLSEGQ